MEVQGQEILGPLTTIFTPPSHCASYQTNLYQVVDATGSWFAQGPIEPGNCFPSGYGSLSSQYYSPGVCPSGYQPACMDTNQIGSVTETIYTCCPARFRYLCHYSGHRGWGGCFYDLPETATTLTSLYRISGDGEGGVTTTRLADAMVIGGAINAQSVQVRFRPLDLVTLTSTLGGPTSSSALPPTQTITPAADDGVSVGLTSGEIAGICVGAVVGGLAILGAVIFGFMQRRKPARPIAELMADSGARSGAYTTSQSGIYLSTAYPVGQSNQQNNRETSKHHHEPQAEFPGVNNPIEMSSTP